MEEPVISRPVKKLETTMQYSLFETRNRPGQNLKKPKRPQLSFNNPDPDDIYIGDIKLEKHLIDMKETIPFVLRELLEDLNFTNFEQEYKSSGRPPYSPRLMVGLILYGILKGQTSLRQLEQMSRLDIGCWWVSGGIFPDHSIIGRFIQKHSK